MHIQTRVRDCITVNGDPSFVDWDDLFEENIIRKCCKPFDKEEPICRQDFSITMGLLAVNEFVLTIKSHRDEGQ